SCVRLRHPAKGTPPSQPYATGTAISPNSMQSAVRMVRLLPVVTQAGWEFPSAQQKTGVDGHVRHRFLLRRYKKRPRRMSSTSAASIFSLRATHAVAAVVAQIAVAITDSDRTAVVTARCI